MATFALIANSLVAEIASATFPVNPAFVWVDVSAVSPAPQFGWTAAQVGGTWSFTAPPGPPPPSMQQQVSSLLAAGLTITSTATPALNGTYMCDPASQANISGVFGLIQQGGGNSFPNGMASLPWATAQGVVTFEKVSDWMNMAKAVGGFILDATLVAVTGQGSLPPASVTIP